MSLRNEQNDPQPPLALHHHQEDAEGSLTWGAAVKRLICGVGAMRRLHDRMLAPNNTGLSNSPNHVWLLGVPYKIDDDSDSSQLAAFEKDFSSRILLTYRKGFCAIGDSKYTSDQHWGCMLRSSQMLVAQALLFHRLGRSWRKPSHNPAEKEYLQLLKLFGDSESSEFSIHNLLRAGKNCGLAVGSWAGPYAVCRAWEALVRSKTETADSFVHHPLPMVIYVVSGDENGGRGGAPVVCIRDASRLCLEFSKGQSDWAPILLLIPLVLGLDKINTRYIPSLEATFTFKQSLGILGGKPGSSTYIVGVQDAKAIYLDPHLAQQVITINEENLDTDTSSYHCNTLRHIPLESIDPSLALGFYCRDQDDFVDFCRQATKLVEDSHGAPLFTVSDTPKIQTASYDDNADQNCEIDMCDAAHLDSKDKDDMGNEDDWQLL
uniref:Cysteine protease n=1 Tax=Kalanchoe fedtschenkoi TaxID=63787 RepID=A0A7N0TPJ9_KALFE